MKKPLLITIAVTIVVLLLGVWAYLMMFGSPSTPNEVFTNLGTLTPNRPSPIGPSETPSTETPNTVVNVSGGGLRQLTTRPVAGATVASTTAGWVARYAERGTGHIYDINLETGLETQVSLTTVPRVVEASFSPSGASVALTAYLNYDSEVTVGTLTGDNSITIVSLPPNARNAAFNTEQEVFYTVTNQSGTSGYGHNISTLTRRTLFSTPIENLTMRWGSALDRIYALTKPAASLPGYSYYIQGGLLRTLGKGAPGLTFFSNDASHIRTFIENGTFSSYHVDADSGEESKMAIPMLAEKCTFDTVDADYLWCASPLETVSTSYLEDWYKGVRNSEDMLWLVNVGAQNAVLSLDLREEAGRVIDVTNLFMSPVGDRLLFVNKVDDTLWAYDI